MFREMRACCGILVVTLLLCGVAYPLVCLGFGQMFFYDQAQGSLVGEKGKLFGSSLIGQGFSRAAFFHGRPSFAGDGGYDSLRSGASHFALFGGSFRKVVGERVEALRSTGIRPPYPPDLVTTSASGLDPDLSPASAFVQAERVASARGVKPQRIHDLIESMITPRAFGFLGEPRVNALALNRALDGLIREDIPPVPSSSGAEPASESGLVIPLPAAQSEDDSLPASGVP